MKNIEGGKSPSNLLDNGKKQTQVETGQKNKKKRAISESIKIDSVQNYFNIQNNHQNLEKLHFKDNSIGNYKNLTSVFNNKPLSTRNRHITAKSIIGSIP